MLYRAGAGGASLDELAERLRVTRKDHLRDRLKKLDKDTLILHHPKSDRYYITKKGINLVEEKGYAQPA
jgi:predicted transcriptional regulator